MPDLIDIPGISEAWTHTRGDSRITIAVLDGAADLERSCFEGAQINVVEPFWNEPVPELDSHELKAYLEVLNSDDDRETIRLKCAELVPNEKKRLQIYSHIHATFLASQLFGQPNSPVEGLVPQCKGISIRIANDLGDATNSLALVRALHLAQDMGADIIHVALCQPNLDGHADDLLTKAIRQCQDNNILVVSPAGNAKGECMCSPAVLPGVLSVGAMKDSGEPFKFSNWGGPYQKQGILAPGGNILGAQPQTEETTRQKGTSVAAPVVTGVAALLMSLQRAQGGSPDAEAVRAAILNSAISCDPNEVEEPERCLRGKLNIPGAFQLITGNELKAKPDVSEETEDPGILQSSELDLSQLDPSKPPPPNRRHITRVYALGTLGYDFGTETRRDSFKQLMPTVNVGGTSVPANPYDARQMADYLENNLGEAHSLIWTLNLELTPVYAIEPTGAFSADVYEVLQTLLSGQVQAEDQEDYIDRVSLPGLLTHKTVKLFSGQTVPLLRPESPRGIYGWNTNTLVDTAVGLVQAASADADEQAIRKSLSSFLNRIYYDLRNLGQTARDRALNYVATNAFQAVATFAEAISMGMELSSIETEKSPFCRYHSNCWDVKLKFFDPENGLRAKKVFRFTVDVADLLPVSLGKVRTWSVAN